MSLAVAVEDEPPASDDAALLLRFLDRELHERYPASSVHGYDPVGEAGGGAFVVARVEGRAVGCGAVRPIEPEVGEVKRMFVAREVRGRGVARAILGALEGRAAALGLRTLRLETGARQPEAIGLYESCGYRRIPPFGEYASDPWSVCFEKVLSGPLARRTPGW